MAGKSTGSRALQSQEDRDGCEDQLVQIYEMSCRLDAADDSSVDVHPSPHDVGGGCDSMSGAPEELH